ncbi:uncharacterized protein LACBIDRAFT_328894 [Laccaria bicolor S238N-H82]|uniref:Predicted protein n=1 Tax=Laccaria bicolor (strain S238N-H82 / ATCC MYA-4686) TaxID=486041 RepID=B0DGC1_LACBS|nr:uncharacterized protein LACBIDRAFT_328894 [Laccaria bicolor S238N-H82]EDR06247.1 predicted protein [Laccaria bicolor S238N-H82]|eukprot:XP_001883108.1 predicted protein [Laccaria bicolor S238N-H82]
MLAKHEFTQCLTQSTLQTNRSGISCVEGKTDENQLRKVLYHDSRSPGRLKPFLPKGKARIRSVAKFIWQVQTLPTQGQSANSLNVQSSSHNEKAQLANTLWAAHPATPWVIGVEFPVAACPNGENFIIEQAVFSNASTNSSSGRFRPFPPKGKARIRSMSKVQTHPTKGKERIRSVSKDK